MTPSAGSAVTLEAVVAAAARIEPSVVHTPLLDASGLGLGPLWLKAESLQRTGSFKVRGAFNAVLQLSPAQRAAGVITLSAGNHGIALALAAKSQGVRCIVVVPADAPAIKTSAIARLGAELVPVPRAELGERVEAERERRGLTLVHPFDDDAVIAGQGTVGLEILAGADPQTIVVPVGGGGLIAGIATAVKAQRPAVRIIGVEPETSATVRDSLRAGRPVPPARLDTVADGLAAPYTRARNLDLIGRFVDDLVVVSDQAIVEALRMITLGARLVVEPAGAAAIAALMTGRVQTGSRTAVAVLTGSNVDPQRLAGWLAEEPKIPGLTRPGI
ncbi:MAG TPA: pyridoxal-phosphate dependent enzyme [Candidatus Limnocylindrales bacterium]|nr:pyridoxal-phosphate dependent enzyme [Candidatus Limnocylindrales bacterium]